ncbi:MAG: hypothetical protein IJY84_01350 [Clostridia bacterium]|nr:hypothetical protein [Clostridia bacterium]
MKKIIERPKITLWSRISTWFLWYAIKFAISLAVFLIFFDLRLVFRAVDVITNDALYSNFNVLALQLIIECVLILTSFFFVVKDGILFYGVLLNIDRIKKTDELLSSGGNSFGFEGEQGVGKTRSVVYASILQSAKKSEELCLKYYSALPMRDKLLNDRRFWELRRFKAREEAFEFYFKNSPGKIPCLYGNVDIEFGGLRPHVLKPEHFTMQEKLFENNVKILTEADDMFPNTLRKKRKKKKDGEEDDNEDGLDVNAIDKFVGLDRQYTNGSLVSDTHANSDVFKSIRACQSFTLYLTRAEFRYTPGILKSIHERICKKILDTGDDYVEATDETPQKAKAKHNLLKKLDKLAKRAKFFEMLMKRTSITRIYYRRISGPERFQQAEKEEFFVLPNQVPYDYDDRIKQPEYPFAVKIDDITA